MATKPASTAAVSAGLPISAGLKGVLAYREGAGSTTAEAVTGDAYAIPSGWTWATLDGNPAIEAQGPNFLEIPALDVGTSDPLSVFTRLRPLAASSQIRWLYGRGKDGAGGWGAYLSLTAAGTSCTFAVIATSPGTAQVAAAASGVQLGTTVNVLGVWTPGQSVKIYLDGVLVTTTATDRTNLRSSTAPAAIGRHPGGGAGTCEQTRLDLTAVWDRALTDADAATLHADPYAMFAASSSPLLFTANASGFAGGGLL